MKAFDMSTRQRYGINAQDYREVGMESMIHTRGKEIQWAAGVDSQISPVNSIERREPNP
jgi:hypothetical protein